MAHWKSLLTRILLSLPFHVGALYLLLMASGTGHVIKMVLGIALMLVGALILMPRIGDMFSLSFQHLFYPDAKFTKIPPIYGPAESLVKKGLYEEAMEAYRGISEKHPDEAKPYLDMIDVAAYRMRDVHRADQIYQQGIENLRDPRAIHLLKTLYKDLRARGETETGATRRTIRLPPKTDSPTKGPHYE